MTHSRVATGLPKGPCKSINIPKIQKHFGSGWVGEVSRGGEGRGGEGRGGEGRGGEGRGAERR